MLSADLNMNNNQIVNLATCTSPTDAATKAYVDTAVTSIAGLGSEGSLQLSGKLNMGFNKIEDLDACTEDGDAANKLYVDASLTRLSRLLSKRCLSITAEKSGALVANQTAFSFGGGAAGMQCGYVFMTKAKIVKGSFIALAANDQITAMSAAVALVINGELTNNVLRFTAADSSIVKCFSPPIEIKVGDLLNFTPLTSHDDAKQTIVSVLAEYTMEH
jgi:hypothetical protein